MNAQNTHRSNFIIRKDAKKKNSNGIVPGSVSSMVTIGAVSAAEARTEMGSTDSATRTTRITRRQQKGAAEGSAIRAKQGKKNRERQRTSTEKVRAYIKSLTHHEIDRGDSQRHSSHTLHFGHIFRLALFLGGLSSILGFSLALHAESKQKERTRAR